MTLLSEILFWLLIFTLFHSYVLFPFIIEFLAKKKTDNKFFWYKNSNELPSVSILLASYNEEKNIEQKILSTFNTDYPTEKIEFLIGSDNSDDLTNQIIEKYCQKYPQIKFFNFNKRQGKIKIINKLVDKAKNNILIHTDTKVFFKENTIYELVKNFKNSEISITGGILINNSTNPQNISFQENAYMNREMQIKYNEGLIWQNSMGVFGAIYAIRAEKFQKVPENYTVDDFYVTLKVIENKGKVIFNKNAEAHENLAGNISEEFRRKVRIATGNFQNLKTFSKLLIPKFNGNAFCFWSHKAIRWIGPFIIIFSFLINISLINILFYKIILITYIITFLLPLIDFLLKKIKINLSILRFITHFYSMNIALLVGFFKFAKGIKTSIWQPSKRDL